MILYYQRLLTDEIYNYKFLTETEVKKTGITIRKEPNSTVRAEARAY